MRRWTQKCPARRLRASLRRFRRPVPDSYVHQFRELVLAVKPGAVALDKRSALKLNPPRRLFDSPGRHLDLSDEPVVAVEHAAFLQPHIARHGGGTHQNTHIPIKKHTPTATLSSTISSIITTPPCTTVTAQD